MRRPARHSDVADSHVSSPQYLRWPRVAAHRRAWFPGPLPAPAGLVLDSVVDSPFAVVDALRGRA